MMKFATLPHDGRLRYIAACVTVLTCTAAVMAQSPESQLAAYKETVQSIVVILGFGGIIVSAIWSFFNKKNHDKLNETIAELKELLSVKEKRIELLNASAEEAAENHRLIIEGMMAKHQLELNECRTDARNRQVSNLALVDQNLLMRGILEGLQKEGKWSGNDGISIHSTNS